MPEPLNVGMVSFARLPFVLNLQFLSPLQHVILKAINGESLNNEEGVAYCKHTGKSDYTPRRVANVNILTGRRSGKSTCIAPTVCLYYATQWDWQPYLRTSPWATFAIISASKRQAGEIFDATVAMIRQSPYLGEFLNGGASGIKTNVIELNNRCRLLVLPADHTLIRGFASPLAILDENAFYGEDGGDIKNSDTAIEAAITPAMSQFGDLARLIKISTPNGERGIMWRDYQHRDHDDVLFFHATSREMNPSLSDVYLQKERLKGESYYRREYLAEWVASETTLLDPRAIDVAIMPEVTVCPPQAGSKYVAATDYATKDDRWTWAIAHQDRCDAPQPTTVIDYADHRQGAASEELNPEIVIADIAHDCQRYGCRTIYGDQNAAAALKSLFRRHGITFREHPFTNASKRQMFMQLQVALNTETIRLPNHPLLVQDLKDLRERRTRTNQIQIGHVVNGHDDYADVVALCHTHVTSGGMQWSMPDTAEEDAGSPLRAFNGDYLRAPDAGEIMTMLGTGSPF